MNIGEVLARDVMGMVSGRCDSCCMNAQRKLPRNLRKIP